VVGRRVCRAVKSRAYNSKRNRRRREEEVANPGGFHRIYAGMRSRFDIRDYITLTGGNVGDLAISEESVGGVSTQEEEKGRGLLRPGVNAKGLWLIHLFDRGDYLQDLARKARKRINEGSRGNGGRGR